MKISEHIKTKGLTGNKKGMSGKHHTKATKAKLRKMAKRRWQYHGTTFDKDIEGD